VYYRRECTIAGSGLALVPRCNQETEMARRAKKAEEQEAAAQVPPTRQTGSETATGQALEAGSEDQTVPTGEDRGSKTVPEGGWPKPDVEAPAPQGAQLEPARFTSNGQLPHNQVPTPTGSVPVGATGLSADDARAKMEELHQAHDDYVARKGTRQRLSHATIQRLHSPELRAIAEARGYNLGEGGGERSIRQAFIEEQDADPELREREDKVAAARSGAAAQADED
jgi:hypothetical protein